MRLQLTTSIALLASAVCLSSVLAPAPANANDIQNPNFATPGGPPPAETHTGAGGFLVGSSGWQALGTVSNASGGSTYSQFGPGYAGATYYGELNNGNLGGWQQVIPTIAGNTYNLSFAYNYLSPADGSTTSFTASLYNGSVAYTTVPGSDLNGGSYSVFGAGVGVAGQPWQTASLSFVAASSETTVRFTSTEWHTNSYGPAIDGVLVTPEPSSLILCGLGAVGLFFAARRRHKA